MIGLSTGPEVPDANLGRIMQKSKLNRLKQAYPIDIRPETLREALDVIEDMLRAKRYSRDLWNVLTALRGPDSRNRWVKTATTGVIRHTAFPSRPNGDLSAFKEDDSMMAKRRVLIYAGKIDSNHFREHVKDAFDSLGLKIKDKN